MIKAFKEIGIKKALTFAFQTPFLLLFDILCYPFLRVFFLRLFGAEVGKNVVMGRACFVNVYRTGFKGLIIRDNCVIDDYAVLDLANKITLGSHVTLAFGAMLITHMNVGYKDHPLQKYFPAANGEIVIGNGSFVGAHAVILNGVTLGEGVCVAAGSVVNKDTGSWVLMGGTPARAIKELKK